VSDNSADFKKLVADAGIPTTEDELKAEWQAEVDASGYTNTSEYSPLWRLITNLVTTPVLWLINLIIEQVLPQAFAKTATGTFLDILAWGVNLERKQAAKAVGRLQFTRTDTAGTLAIPLGTVVQTAAINGNIYSLVTTEAKSFADGEANLLVSVEATEAGAAYNLAAGYYSILPTPIAGVTAVTNLADWLLTPGADTESDDELRLRIRNQFSAVNQWHTDAVYRSIISSFDGVHPDNVYFEHGAPRGPGSANAYILFDIGTPDASFIASVQSEITDNGNHGHGDDLQVFAMAETLHDISLDYWEVENLTAAESTQLATDIEQFVRAAFRENLDYSPTRTAPYQRFSFSRLGQELHREFPSIESLSFANADLVPALEIPRINSLTVTKQ